MKFYKINENNKEEIATLVTTSTFDSHTITFSRAANCMDNNVITQTTDWECFKKIAICEQYQTVQQKANVPAFFPVSFIPNAPKKTHEYAIDRYFLTLDFDKPGFDFNDLYPIIKDYVWIAHESYNAFVPEKGNCQRLKVWIPLSSPVPITYWGDSTTWTNGWMRVAIIEWTNSIGLVGSLQPDSSAHTFAQYQASPALNPKSTQLEQDGKHYAKVYVNDDSGTALLDPYKTWPKPLQQTAPAMALNPSTSNDQEEEADQAVPTELTPVELQFVQRCKLDKTIVQEVIDLLCSYDWLTKSSYQSQGLDEKGKHDPRFTLVNMCCALQLIGVTKNQWRQVHKHMTSKLGRSTNSADQVWTAEYNRQNKLLISINNNKIMKLHHKQHFGLTRTPINYAQYRQERIDAEYVEDTKAIEYLSPTDLSSDKKVTVVIGDTGIGKTSAVKNIRHANARIAVPTKLIKQQQQDNQIQTYDSAHKIDFDFTMPEWFVLDEVHNLPTMGFRSEALIKCYDNIKDEASKYKKVILLSATLDTAMAQMIARINSDISESDDIEVIKRTKLNGPKKTYRVVERSCDAWKYNDVLIQTICDQVKLGKLVYVVNDNGKINAEIGKALDTIGIDTMCVSRENIDNVADLPTIECDALTEFIESDKFKMKDHNLKCILTTRIGCEGVNVCDDVDAVSVIAVGDLDPTYIRQSSGRFRNAKNIDVLHIQQHIRKTPDIDAWINKRKLEISTRKTSVQYWCATNPKPSYADWVKFAGNGIKLESEWQRAFVEDGMWFDKTTNRVREVPEIAEIVMQAAIDKAKFYADPKCQEIYMAEAGFDVQEGIIVDYVEEQLIKALSKASEDVKAYAKKSEADKRAKCKDILDKYLKVHSHIKPSHYNSLAKKLGMDEGVIMAVDNMVSDLEEKLKWIANAAVHGWTSDEVKWKYVSDSSEVVKAVATHYPVGTWFAPSDLGGLVEFILKAQIDRMSKFGYTDISTRLSATTSIWYDKLEKIDVNTGSVTKPLGWSNWLIRNGFVNLEKSRKRGGGKQVEGYVVV